MNLELELLLFDALTPVEGLKLLKKHGVVTLDQLLQHGAQFNAVAANHLCDADEGLVEHIGL